MRVHSKTLLIHLLLLVIWTVCKVNGLQCYQCGAYSSAGAGSVSPCNAYDESNLKQCGSSDTHCVKYVNEGIIVRQCVPECTTGTKGLTEFYCCEEDGCNSASYSRPRLVVILTAVIGAAVLAFYH